MLKSNPHDDTLGFGITKKTTDPPYVVQVFSYWEHKIMIKYEDKTYQGNTFVESFRTKLAGHTISQIHYDEVDLDDLDKM